MFHCGYDGWLENREASPENPQAECFYDENGVLVDKKHKYARCRGTKNDYPKDQWYNHAVKDRGGILKKGLPAFYDSRKKDVIDNYNYTKEFYGL